MQPLQAAALAQRRAHTDRSRLSWRAQFARAMWCCAPATSSLSIYTNYILSHPCSQLLLARACSRRVDAVQQALVSVTGIAVSDQIVMCHGARLDPAKPLAAYKLPQVRSNECVCVCVWRRVSLVERHRAQQRASKMRC